MDRVVNEITDREEIASELGESRVRNLSDFQLALVGGGCADPIMA